MTSNHRKGKRYENYLTNRLELKHTGYVGYECPDIEGETVVIDAKYRKSLPLWLKEPLEKLAGQAENQLALVIWHERGVNHDEDLVVMSLKDFEKLFNDPKCPEGTGKNV